MVHLPFYIYYADGNGAPVKDCKPRIDKIKFASYRDDSGSRVDRGLERGKLNTGSIVRKLWWVVICNGWANPRF